MKKWRPPDWKNDWMPRFGEQYWAYEVGADAMLEALKKEGKYIDASKYPYGVVLNEVPPIQKLTRDFKGYVVIIPEEKE